MWLWESLGSARACRQRAFCIDTQGRDLTHTEGLPDNTRHQQRKDIEMYEVDTELRRPDRRTIRTDNTECEMEYEKNDDMTHLVDSKSPTEPVNSQSSE